MKLLGTSALVSGGASGLGRATAHRLVAEGTHVVVVDLPTSRGAEVAAELGGLATFVPADVTDEASVAAAVEAAAALAPLRLAVTCAGVLSGARTVGREGAADLAALESVIRVNVMGTFNVARLAAAAMTELRPDATGDRGVLVFTSSIAAFDGQIRQAAYAASKGAVHSMTLPIARDLAKLGIRANSIAPGIMGTPMMTGLPEELQRSLGDQVPFPSRLGRPQEFADLVVHMAENTYLNGSTVRLDGALRMAPK